MGSLGKETIGENQTSERLRHWSTEHKLRQVNVAPGKSNGGATDSEKRRGKCDTSRTLPNDGSKRSSS
eukprot:11803206-Heterocapsa_arctica.AAC.1